MSANKSNTRCAENVAAIFAFLTLLFLAGCDRTPQEQGPQYANSPANGGVSVYRLAIPPLHNTSKLVESYQPLIEYLNQHIEGAHFELEASRDYQAYEVKFRAREPEFLLPNPWQTIEAMKVGYHVMVMAGDVDDFRGIFIVRRDSGIKVPADLKGKVVSYPSPTALAACIMPQDFLQHHGIDVKHDIENRYVGSQESSIMNVYLRQSDAGATWPPPWRAFQKDHPAEAAQLKVIWETEPLVNNSVMARDDVSIALRDRVRNLLLELEHTDAGRAILARMETARMHPAGDADYEPVREYIKHFEKEIRPVEQQ